MPPEGETSGVSMSTDLDIRDDHFNPPNYYRAVLDSFAASKDRMSDRCLLDQIAHVEEIMPTICQWTAWIDFTQREIAIRTLKALSKKP